MAAEVDNYLGLLLKQGVSSDIVNAKERCQKLLSKTIGKIVKISRYWLNLIRNMQRIMRHKTIHSEVFGIR